MSLQFIDENWSWDIPLFNFLESGNYPDDSQGWNSFFRSERIQTLLKRISDALNVDAKENIIFPPIYKVFRAFYAVPLNKIKVVILGQDPYHDGNAVGLCFSVPPNGKLNPSLQNIYKELNIQGNGSLLSWAEQGCLLLNTALTVRKGEPESHLSIWSDFTEEVIRYVSANTKNVAWLLMGAKALAFKPLVDESKHTTFITSHPSPFSARSGFRGYPAFLGSGVFKKINEFLGDRKINF